MRDDDKPGFLCFRGNVPVAEIQAAVANAFGIRLIEMTSARRAQPIAAVRQIAMYLARELTPYSLPNLGRMFGSRDHTTIIHGIRVAEKRIAESDEASSKVAEVRELLMAADAPWRQGLLNRIDDPAVRKILIMRWWECDEIKPSEAERLIHNNELEAA